MLTQLRIPLNRTGVYPYYDSSLRAYYAFDEGESTRILDSTMNENIGTIVGSAAWVTPSACPYGARAFGYADVDQVLLLAGTSTTGMPAFITGQDLTATVTVLPTQGALFAYDPRMVNFRGARITAVPYTLQTATGGNRVVYAPNSRLSSNAAALDSVSFTVRDSAAQVSANTATLAIWVQVMDYGGTMEVPMPHATQPVNISLWGYSLGINYATFGVSLPNDERDRVTVTLSCNSCSLSFGNNNSGLVSHLTAQPPGVTTVSQGNNKLVFSGNVADCNNAISGIVYTRMAFYSGPDVINVTIFSGGHFYYAGTAVTVAQLPLSLSINSIPIVSSFVPSMIPASSTLGAFCVV